MQTDPFRDQETFMVAFGQATRGENPEQFLLYQNLVMEETQELFTALKALRDLIVDHERLSPEALIRHNADVVDGAIDTMVVLIGLLFSMGIRPDKAWREVHASNMAKLDENGKPIYRKDGKVQKPATWRAPDLARVVIESWEKNPAA